MSLVRWFRKNNSKVMAIVVIVLMVGFVGGSALTYLLQGSRGLKDTVATITGMKITNNDLAQARRELELLRMIRADDLLRAQGLQGVFMAELLFSAERGGSSEMINRLKQTIRQNLYPISEKQINDIYRRSVPPHVYWCCLKEEARRAGIGMRNSEVGAILGNAIPQLFRGATYQEFMGDMITKQRIPEEQILSTVGQMLDVLQYSQIICSNQAVTVKQILNGASTEQESLDLEYVAFEADVFIDPNGPEPSEAELTKHFDQYKTFFPNEITDDNPYGFGYKQPDRVSLDYIVVKLDDVRTIVTPPTQDEIGDYYSRNKEQLFTEQVQSDPNDPNSPMIDRVKSYAEVSSSISKQLLTDKTNSKADSIIQEARSITEANLQKAGIDVTSATSEQLKENAGDYNAIAQQLSEKHKIKVYTGQTGLLNALDIQMDQHLGGIFLRGYGENPVEVSKAVFAVEELGVSELGPFDVAKPVMYDNIGPLKNPYGYGSIMAMVRIVEAHKAAPPESYDMTYSTHSLKLDPNEPETEDDTYSVKEEVVDDFKKLNAMEATRTKAEEFMNLIEMEDWDKATAVFEKLYGQHPNREENDPNTFRVQNEIGLRRIPLDILKTITVLNEGQPSRALQLNDIKSNKLYVDTLYSLVPADSNTVEELPVMMEHKPDLRVLVIKDITVKRIWKEQFEQMKTQSIFRQESALNQSMAAVHFNPANILKRMNFELTETDETDQDTADANEPEQSEAQS